MSDALVLGNVQLFTGIFLVITVLYFFYGMFLLANAEDDPCSMKHGIWTTVGFLVSLITTANLFMIEAVLSK